MITTPNSLSRISTLRRGSSKTSKLLKMLLYNLCKWLWNSSPQSFLLGVLPYWLLSLFFQPWIQAGKVKRFTSKLKKIYLLYDDDPSSFSTSKSGSLLSPKLVIATASTLSQRNPNFFDKQFDLNRQNPPLERWRRSNKQLVKISKNM